MSIHSRVVRIGCGSGFWGDTPEGARQLIEQGKLHYLVFDYLAEITMSILARARQRNPEEGYALDFVTEVIAPHASEIARQNLKIVANAGGVHPLACKAAIERALQAAGVQLTVAAVTGDDVMPQVLALYEGSAGTVPREMFSGAPLPAKPISANAYLGAFPIAQALGAGADIVVTGRCVDSALVLGPLIHEFGWGPGEHDLLAAGSLAGHVIECGPQCTGGFSTDWEALREGWADIGFPIVECAADGSFIVTKPEGTGGAVTRQTVAEQVTYEIGDPSGYALPDVVCDLSGVQAREVGPDRVKVIGARGHPATAHYKVSVTHGDGYRCLATLLVRGIQAPQKARAIAAAIVQRTAAVLARKGHAPLRETSVEILGAEEAYGPHARPGAMATREVVLKLGVRHAEARALDIFSREVFPTSTSTVQGVAGVFGGRPKVQPVVRLFSFLLDKQQVPVTVHVGAEQAQVLRAPAVVTCTSDSGSTAGHSPDAKAPAPGSTVSADLADADSGRCEVPLLAVAFARSGDKGDLSNIGVLARRAEFVDLIREQLTGDQVREYFAHLVQGPVERFEWPGLDAFNFVMHEALAGGGTASLRYDPQGKAHAQILLDFPMSVPQAWAEKGWLHVAG